MATVFPPSKQLRALVAVLNSIAPDAAPKLTLVLSKVLAGIATPSASLFTAEEEEQLVEAFGLAAGGGAAAGRAGVRVFVEGSAYLLETAAYHNLKTAAFGAELLALGVGEAQAVAFGNAWSAGSAAAINRMRATPLGTPLVLLGSSYRLGLTMGSSAASGPRGASAVLDLALGRGRTPGGSSASGMSAGSSVTEVLSLELDRSALAGLLERLDAVQLQLDTLS